ncbi:MAG: hypothetical protein Fur0018_23270 [Anaerolineales bacterium]
MVRMRWRYALLGLLLLLGSCNLPQRVAEPIPAVASVTPSGTPHPTERPHPSSTSIPSLTPSPSSTPTPTASPTITLTPTITPTPTFDFPDATVKVQSHCRYGPAKAYLHAADLYPGDMGQVWGRSSRSSWLYVRFDKLDYACWVAPSIVDVQGDIHALVTQEPRLPVSVLYPPPANVRAVRNGNQVTISWERVPMTEDDDRGYMLDTYVCQGGAYIWWPVSFKNQYTTEYTVTDEAGCPAPSGGKLAAAEKHGYTDWVEIPWPAP